MLLLFRLPARTLTALSKTTAKVQTRNMASVIKNIQTTLSENLGGAAHKSAPEGTGFSLDLVPDQTGKVAVVTGGSEGIGYGW